MPFGLEKLWKRSRPTKRLADRPTQGEWYHQYLERIKAKYDGANNSPNQDRYWASADNLSPKSANDRYVRQKVRSRARYEAHESNSYANGMVWTKVGATIGKGPRLQFSSQDAELNRFIEREFTRWSRAVRLAQKLRTMTAAKIVDGEAFAEKINNNKLRTPVQLDFRLIEADLWTDPEHDAAWKPNEDDGIKYDKSGNPKSYRRLTEHPGNTYKDLRKDRRRRNTTVLDYDDLPAADVIHWFRPSRPDQTRGISEMVSALPLFAELRRWIYATVACLETAAHFAGVMYSDASSFCEEPDEVDMLERIDLENRALLTLPSGWKMGQLKPEHPNAQFEMFEEKLVMQIARAFRMPLNVAMGSSRRHNFASGRLDYMLYYQACDEDRQDCEEVVLDRIFEWWLDEALEIPGYLPNFRASEIERTWHFPPRPPIDLEAQAKADEIYFNLGWKTDEQFFLENGIDPDEHYDQAQRQTERRKAIDEDFPQPGITKSESLVPESNAEDSEETDDELVPSTEEQE